MPLTRLDYQRPDYIGQVGSALGEVGKTVEDYSPAPDFIQKYAEQVYSGKMDPREAAIRAKLEAGGHLPPQGQQLTGGNVTFSGPQPGAPMGKVNAPPQMPSQAPAPQAPAAGGFTGQREFTGPEEVVTGNPTQQPGDVSALNAPPQKPMAPILNKDVPRFLQAAGQMQKHDPMDTYMKLYALGLRGDALAEKMREFEGMAPVRQSMINQRDAGISNMPFKNQMAAGNLGARWAGVDVARGNLATRQNEGYLRETKETAAAIPALAGIIQTFENNPGVVPGDDDYAARKASRIMGGLPFVGNTLKEGIETVADTALSPEQRQLRAQIALAVQPYRKLNVGTQITPGEFALIDMITGQSIHPRDQKAALIALKMSMEARQARAKAAFPEAAGRIPDTAPGQALPAIPQAYPTDSGDVGNIGQPGPEGPSLQDELNAAPQNAPRLRGTVKSTFGGP